MSDGLEIDPRLSYEVVPRGWVGSTGSCSLVAMVSRVLASAIWSAGLAPSVRISLVAFPTLDYRLVGWQPTHTSSPW